MRGYGCPYWLTGPPSQVQSKDINGFNSIYKIDPVPDHIQLCGESLRVRVLCQRDEGQMFEVVWRPEEISTEKSKWTAAN